jgi:hypothetical protein
LGNPVHRGRIWGVSSKMSWKEGFPANANRYKKHKKLKPNLDAIIDAKG